MDKIAIRLKIIKLALDLDDKKTVDIQLKNLKILKVNKKIESLLNEEIKNLIDTKYFYLEKIIEFNNRFRKNVIEVIKDILEIKKEIEAIEISKTEFELNENRKKIEKMEKEIVDTREIINSLKNKLAKNDVFDSNYDSVLEELSEIKKIYEKQITEMEIFKSEYNLIKTNKKQFNDYESIFDIYEKFRVIIEGKEYKDISLIKDKNSLNNFTKNRGFEKIILEKNMQLKQLEEEINILKNSPTYQFIKNIKDFDIYFNNLVKKLTFKKVELENKKFKLLKDIDVNEIEEYQFWHREF